MVILSNCTLKDATLCPRIRKPFDVLAEGLVSKKKWRQQDANGTFFGRPGKLGGVNTEAIVTSKMSNLVMTRGEVAILE